MFNIPYTLQAFRPYGSLETYNPRSGSQVSDKDPWKRIAYPVNSCNALSTLRNSLGHPRTTNKRHNAPLPQSVRTLILECSKLFTEEGSKQNSLVGCCASDADMDQWM